MIPRRFVLCLVAAGVSLPALAADPDLANIQSVYLLPMNGGLDQYLANRIVQAGRFQVVTDPASAQAVLTDRLGGDFEDKMKQLYPPPPAPPEAKEEKEQDKKDAEAAEDRPIGALLGEAAPVTRNSTFNRGKGNIFLVDRLTGRVLWSQYARPRTTRADDLDRVASSVASSLAGAAKRAAKTK